MALDEVRLAWPHMRPLYFPPEPTYRAQRQIGHALYYGLGEQRVPAAQAENTIKTLEL